MGGVRVEGGHGSRTRGPNASGGCRGYFALC